MTNAAKERDMIIGTEGNKDYLVIAEQDGFILGLKPLLLIGGDASQYGFRLRMQQAETGKPDIENKQATLDSMQKAFSQIPWSKRSSTRFSTVLLSDCAYGVEFIDKISDEALGGFGVLISEIEGHLDEGIELLDLLDTVTFVKERYTSMLAEVRTAYAEFTAKSNKTKNSTHVADVLSFPTDDIE